ncbi:putative target of rapamycin (TOR) kinase 1 [Trypanosoma conorhini]|uniref:Serine/threonine-protein kinase TOR n=1 Tax=Trypanosoma conorhini TaxID=83891 RepID=A0A3R7LNM2_9TRYP|nr:putative target of rapamycin (TOR) kinase 1 [Trypanosoma conorhini]RNF17895.1 putative target of rapamycin (TOR) kinase 1 [Trypanosoma conorhini]
MESCVHPLIGQLQPIFNELQSSTSATLPSVILKLEYIIGDESDIFFQSSSGGGGEFRASHSGLSNWINTQIRDLFSKFGTQLAGILCAKALLDADYIGSNSLLQFFLYLLEGSVKSSDVFVAEKAAEVWGLLLNNSGSFAEGIAQARLKTCIVDLQMGGETVGKVAATLFLCQLLKHTPSTVVPSLDVVLEEVRVALRDPSERVREKAACVLHHALSVMDTSMGPSAITKWRDVFLKDSLRGLESKKRELQHGAILCFNAVLTSILSAPSSYGTAVSLYSTSVSHVHEIWNCVNTSIAKPNLSQELRRELLNSLILLASYDGAAFRERSLPVVLAAASTIFRTAPCREEKSMMFLAVGKLAALLRDHVILYLECMMPHIQAALGPKSGDERCLEAVTCFATLAEVSPKAVRPYLRQILAPLFSGPPTVGFAKDIARICEAFPELRSTCLSKILEATKQQLLNAHQRLSMGAGESDADAVLSLQCLSALGSLDFSGYSTLPFLCDAVIRYVSFPHEELRRAAINLCFKLVLSGCAGSQLPCGRTPEGVVLHHGRDHSRLVNTVIKALVNAAVSDPESDIRLHTLESFTEEYDHTLSLQHIVSSLFPALYDKHQNRLAVVRLLGRVSRRNPAHVCPMLRKIMVQCLTEIQFFEHAKKQEQAFSLLGAIVESTPGFCKPYVPSLLHSCVKRLREPSQKVSVLTALLSCIGKLVRYAEGDDVRVAAEIRPIVVQHILDSSHLPKKREALRALGDIIRTTRDVNIFEVHPELLSVLLQALHGGFKETWPVRNDVLQLMGVIGAVDPIRVKEILRDSRVNDSNTEVVPAIGLRSEDPIAQTVVRSVLQILSLPSLTDEQSVGAVNVIVKLVSLREDSSSVLVPYHAEILSSILKHAQMQVRKREDILISLTSFVSHIKGYIRPHLDELTSAVATFISSSDIPVFNQTLLLVKQLRRSFREEFRPYLSSLLIPILNAVEESPHVVGEKVFGFFSEMGSLLEDELHKVLPVVCDVIVNASFSSTCRVAAVDTLKSFAQQLSGLRFHASRCVHCLCGVLKEPGRPKAPAEDPLGNAALTTLLAIAQRLGKTFEKFTPIVFPVVAGYYGEVGEEYKRFCSVVRDNINTRKYPEMQLSQEENNGGATVVPRSGASTVKLPRERPADPFETLRHVLRNWVRSNDEDWNHWLTQLAVILLRSSPSPSHGCALTLAELHDPFARQMLYSAFATCYGEMNESTRQEVVSLLSEVLHGPRVPSEVLQELLNLSEYMERLEIRQNAHGNEYGSNCPDFRLFDLPTLMESSERCNLYSKALHYVEIEFFETIREYERGVFLGIPRPLPSGVWQNLLQLCEKSIYLCNLLGQRESANAVLKFIQQNYSMLTGQEVTELSQMMDATLFDKLQWWSQSYRAYEQRLRQEPNKVSNMVGLMKALDALGSYEEVLNLWKLYSVKVNKKDVAELAPMGAHAAWLMRRWDDMEHITEFMSDANYIGTTAIFYRAVLATRKRQFREADRLIKLCRRRLDSNLSALVAESYDRAYELFVGIQQLSELEEVAVAARDVRSVHRWQELWERRLGSMAYEGWPGTLANHTLVVHPAQELDMWLRFVSLSRANGREQVSKDVLRELLGNQSIEAAVANQMLHPAIALGAFQHLYETNRKEKAMEMLEQYLEKVDQPGTQPATHAEEHLAVCHAKLAEWLTHRKKPHNFSKTLRSALQHLHRATDLDSKNGTIWHTWARLHHEAATKNVSGKLSPTAEEHIFWAIDGYLRSVCLSKELEDTLGFLSLWFMHASLPSIQGSAAIKGGIHQVSPTVWLKVIPQIIARIYSRDAVIAEYAYHLMVIIAKSHPQAILYSLNVANTSYQGKGSSESVERQKGPQRVLARIAEFHHNGKAMVNDAALACRELVRCAVLWPELWLDELERVWFRWVSEKNAHNVVLALKPLLDQLKTPETMAESHFAMEFGQLLTEAFDCVEKAASLGREGYMEEAWSRFKTLLKRVDDQISGMSSLALQLVSPRLLQNGRNLSLVVPGQYRENENYPRIASFRSTLKVMNSKQRPRRIFINGSDGNLYKFLLKGHEDLRLDERVMQLLGFANTILKKHLVTKRRGCLIQTYSVTPLSDNAGLVGWVDHCDTLHQIIKEYRINPNYISTELNLMRSMSDDLHHLTVIQHVEPFELALEKTEGADLVRSLWMKAPSAETWLERRTTYVSSLATMSMVGHILGLGDRHPSNLMIHAFSGRVVHIDFGDCFEVAQQRGNYPEKVPFRLTRMLVKAMEMGGIEGLFRHGCIMVMGVLREEGSSLLALLEAFVHDPLVSWWREERGNDGCGNAQNTVTQSTSLTGSLRPIHGEYSVGSLHGTQRSLHRLGAISRVGCQGGETALQQTRKAQRVVNRIKEKLEGFDFFQDRQSRGDDGLSVEEQVSRLIEQATSNENLCVHFSGWCPFW